MSMLECNMYLYKTLVAPGIPSLSVYNISISVFKFSIPLCQDPLCSVFKKPANKQTKGNLWLLEGLSKYIRKDLTKDYYYLGGHPSPHPKHHSVVKEM